MTEGELTDLRRFYDLEREQDVLAWANPSLKAGHRSHIASLIADMLQLKAELAAKEELIGHCQQTREGAMDKCLTLQREVDRLKEGKFTPEELQSSTLASMLQNLCHNLKPTDLQAFRKGCESYQAKLCGFTPPKDEAERLQLKQAYEGQTELCCRCGIDYPKGDLIIDGEVFCAQCKQLTNRVAVAARVIEVTPRDTWHGIPLLHNEGGEG